MRGVERSRDRTTSHTPCPKKPKSFWPRRRSPLSSLPLIFGFSGWIRDLGSLVLGLGFGVSFDQERRNTARAVSSKKIRKHKNGTKLRPHNYQVYFGVSIWEQHAGMFAERHTTDRRLVEEKERSWFFRRKGAYLGAPKLGVRSG